MKSVCSLRRRALCLAGLAALAMPWGSTSAHYVDIGDELVEAGSITLGLALSGRPFAYRDDDGQPAGLDVELAQSIVEASGYRIEIIVIPRRELRAALEAGRVDMINTSALDADARSGALDLGYLAVGDHVLLHQANPFRVRTVGDLSGRVASAIAGSSAEDYARALDSTFRGEGRAEMEVHSFPFSRYAAFPVMMGHAAAYFVDTRAAVGMMQDPESRMRMLEDAFNPVDEVGLALAQGRERTHHVLEHGLAGLVTSGRYDAILERHGVPDALSLFR